MTITPQEHTKDNSDKCPVCGGDVITHSGDEGTGYFEPVNRKDNSDDGLVDETTNDNSNTLQERVYRLAYSGTHTKADSNFVDEIIALVRQHDKQSECRGALMRLVRLKDYKDKNGKTENYLTAQPIAWDMARKALALPSPPKED